VRFVSLLLTGAIAVLPVTASAQSWPPEPIFEPLPGEPILASSQPLPDERRVWTPTPAPQELYRSQALPARMAPPARVPIPSVRPAPVRQPLAQIDAAQMNAAPVAVFEVAQAPLLAQKRVPQSPATPSPPAAIKVLALTPPATPASVAPKAEAPDPLALALTPPAPQAFILPGNTAIELRLDASVSSSFSRVGDDVRLMVVRDVEIDGRVVIPRGMPVMGEVIRSGGNGGFGKGGRVEIAAKSLTLNGKTVALDGTLMSKGKGAGFGKMALFGTLVGVVGMSQVRGKEAIIGAGQTLKATTRTDVAINDQVAALAQPK
jgi:hypothetical protein